MFPLLVAFLVYLGTPIAVAVGAWTLGYRWRFALGMVALTASPVPVAMLGDAGLLREDAVRAVTALPGLVSLLVLIGLCLRPPRGSA